MEARHWKRARFVAAIRPSVTYRIQGLDPAQFAHLVGLKDEELARHGAIRMTADTTPGLPCRVSLDDSSIGSTLLLVNHCSHDADNPYRASHAIFIEEAATGAADCVDTMPPALDRRILSLRAFDATGMMIDAALVQPRHPRLSRQPGRRPYRRA